MTDISLLIESVETAAQAAILLNYFPIYVFIMLIAVIVFKYFVASKGCALVMAATVWLKIPNIKLFSRNLYA